MKKKLDLNNLLAKYEGISHGSPSYQSYSNFQQQEPTRQAQIEEEFYQYKTYQNQQQSISHEVQPVYQNNNKTFKGNFIMSKSEVEQFLLSIKDELKNQQKMMSFHTQNTIKQIHESFQRSHEKIKREILELLDRAFFENQKMIKEELLKQSKIEPPQFSSVYRKISNMDQDINQLLAKLKGAEYRKAIADVVVRDFNVEIEELKRNITSAKTSYISSLGQIQPDRTRIDNIKDNLLKLFYFSKKNNPIATVRSQAPIENQVQQSSGIFSIFKDKTQVQNEQKPERTRKSFFNFGSD